MKLPEKLTLKHFKAIDFLAKNEDTRKDRFLILFFGNEYKEQIESGYHKDIDKAFDKVVEFVESQLKLKQEKPPININLGGTTFELINIKSPSIGWLIDSTSISKDNPVRLVEMCYTPKGSYYGKTDDTGTLINPFSKYEKEILNDFLLTDFYALSAFFLNVRISSLRQSVAQQKGMKWGQRQLRVLRSLRVGLIGQT